MPDTVTHDDVSIPAFPAKIEAPAATNGAPRRAGMRKKLFLGLFGGALVLGGAMYAYDILVLAKHVTTDNAYVGADVADVTPLANGPLRQVLVGDTGMVAATEEKSLLF